MKHPIKFIFAFLVITLLIMCRKDDEHAPEITVENPPLVICHVDEFNNLAFSSSERDGDKSPFHFIQSQTITDPFTLGSPQVAMNLNRLDSTSYVRVGEPNVRAWDGVFDKYDINYFFKDTVIRYFDQYAPAYAGDRYTHITPAFIAVTPLDTSNQNNSVRLVRHVKTETYVDHRCGKSKRRYYYQHFLDGNFSGSNTIDGDRCYSSVFSFKHIL